MKLIFNLMFIVFLVISCNYNNKKAQQYKNNINIISNNSNLEIKKDKLLVKEDKLNMGLLYNFFFTVTNKNNRYIVLNLYKDSSLELYQCCTFSKLAKIWGCASESQGNKIMTLRDTMTYYLLPNQSIQVKVKGGVLGGDAKPIEYLDSFGVKFRYKLDNNYFYNELKFSIKECKGEA